MNEEKTLVIAIEGIDGSGKTLQWERLARTLREEGKTVDCLSFPVYDSFFGREVGVLLSGRGAVRADLLDSRSLCLWYALDRFAAFGEYRKEKETGGWPEILLLNRFTMSNAVYQSIREIDAGMADNWEWVKELEQGQLGLPNPDLYVILDVNPLAAQENVDRKGSREYTEGRDVYESQENLLDRARRRYLDIAAREPNMQIIYSMDDGGKMLLPGEVAALVRGSLRERLNI